MIKKKYLKIAADKGVVDAACYYSIMLYNKIGDNEEIMKYMKSSANAGNVKTMANYVNLYHNSKDEPNSVKNFVHFCKKATDQGDFKSMYMYGLLLKNGDVCKTRL